jgi:hypothetical protein
VRNIALHRADESFFITAVEKFYINTVEPVKNGCAQAVHPVYDAHAAPLHQDWRKLVCIFRQPPNMCFIFP